MLPGFAPTEMVAGLLEKDGGKGILKQIPMRTFAAVEEVAHVVCFLAGPDSSYMTGSLVTVDGGVGTMLGSAHRCEREPANQPTNHQEVRRMALTQTEAFSAVQGAVVGALGVDEDEATPDATLMDELGAESIDLLDILFRIERAPASRSRPPTSATYMQGGIPDDEFGDANGMITAKGLEQLKKVMPQIDPDALEGKLEAEKVITLFTVQNLADMVAQRCTKEARVP